MKYPTFFRTTQIDGLSVFYREAGPKDAPTILLLHGFPSSSRCCDLFYDDRTNVESHPKWQAWMRERKPRLLVIWGRHDLSFDPSEPERYRKDIPNAEVHVLDAGRFALDTKADEIAALVRDFVDSFTMTLSARRVG